MSGDGPRLTWRIKTSYGLGAVALGLKDNGFSYLLLLFYNQVVGLPAPTVGLAVMTALIIDAAIDPVIGHLSDNWRSAWGRRHPFMYAAALPVALSYLLLWNPPLGWSQPALFLYLVVVAVVIRSCLALFEIPSSALAAELTSDYQARTSLMAYRAGFNWYGGLIMSMLTFQVFLRPTPEQPVAQLNADGYAAYGLVSALVMLVAILVSALGTHSAIPALRGPPSSREGPSAALRALFAILKNRALMPMLGAGVFNNMAYGLSVALSLYFNTFFWGFSAGQVSLFILAQFASTAIAISMAGPLSARLGKRNAAVLCKVLSPLLGLAPILLRLADLFPQNGSPWLLPIMLCAHLMSVSFASIVAILHGSMCADIVEDEELRTGKRSEGVMAAANIFVAKTVSGVGIFASSAVLALVGFPQGASPGEVEASVVRNLALVYAPLLLILHGCAVHFILKYPISRESHARTIAALAERRLAAQGDDPMKLSEK